MKKLSSFFLMLIAVVMVGGAVFLSTWDIPAPTAPIEKVLPNDRFQK
jgi:hypothetical protein